MKQQRTPPKGGETEEKVRLIKALSDTKRPHVPWWREGAGVLSILAWLAVIGLLVAAALGHATQGSVVFVAAAVPLVIIALAAGASRDRGRHGK
jgi:CHASE2 domain-containing sensor protein